MRIVMDAMDRSGAPRITLVVGIERIRFWGPCLMGLGCERLRSILGYGWQRRPSTAEPYADECRRSIHALKDRLVLLASTHSPANVRCPLGIKVPDLYATRTDHRDGIAVVLVLRFRPECDRFPRQRHHRLRTPITAVRVGKVYADNGERQFLHNTDLGSCGWPRKTWVTDMAAFDDTFDPELEAACNRLAAWVEPLPEGAVVDATSKLTERDLALILRRLHATRMMPQADQQPVEDRPLPSGRPSVPITVKS